MLLALAYVMVFIVLPALPVMPVLLKVIIGLIWPIFLVLAISMFREVDMQRDTKPADIFEQIKPHMTKLLTLGAICLAYGLALGIFTKGDMDALSVVTESKTQIAPEDILTQTLPLILKLAVLLTPLLMATWFAPMLLAFEKYSLLNAIKSSVAACLQYMLAMGAAWLMLTVFMMLGTMMVGLVAGFMAALSPTLGRGMIALVLLGSLLMATAWMLAFQYVSYREIYKIKPMADSITADL